MAYQFEVLAKSSRECPCVPRFPATPWRQGWLGWAGPGRPAAPCRPPQTHMCLLGPRPRVQHHYKGCARMLQAAGQGAVPVLLLSRLPPGDGSSTALRVSSLQRRRGRRGGVGQGAGRGVGAALALLAAARAPWCGAACTSLAGRGPTRPHRSMGPRPHRRGDSTGRCAALRAADLGLAVVSAGRVGVGRVCGVG